MMGVIDPFGGFIGMDAPFIYKCTKCGHIESIDVPEWNCPVCRGHWMIESDCYPESLAIDKSINGFWKYRNAIPVPGSAVPVTLGEPLTALTAYTVQGIDCLLKHDYQLPSGSFKDRGASVVITMAKHLGINSVIIDSSGNAGASMAAYCASARITCRVFVPASTPDTKIRQITAYGAVPERINGSREDTAAAAREAAAGGFYASHYRHPLFVHGVKTMAFEIWEQLGQIVPGTVIVPVGNGSLILGLITGFRELAARRLADAIPRFIGVQAETCRPVVDLFNGKKGEIACSSTIAEGIAVAEPFLGETIVQAVRDTGGDMIAVTEQDISAAWTRAWKNGLCIEKTSAAALAGTVVRAQADPGDPSPVVTVLTGHGLKSL